MRDLNASLFFPTKCKVTLLRQWDLLISDVPGFARFLAGQLSTQFVMEPGGLTITFQYVYK